MAAPPASKVAVQTKSAIAVTRRRKDHDEAMGLDLLMPGLVARVRVDSRRLAPSE